LVNARDSLRLAGPATTRDLDLHEDQTNPWVKTR
jgi:hypothetical protein